jgi:hypothetical protein
MVLNSLLTHSQRWPVSTSSNMATIRTICVNCAAKTLTWLILIRLSNQRRPETPGTVLPAQGN